MLFYVKDRYTFKTKVLLEAGSYSLIQSVWTDQSEIWTQYSDKVATDDFIYNSEGWVGSIRSIEKDHDTMRIKAVHIEQFFNRDLMWDGLGSSTPAEWNLSLFLNRFYKIGREHIDGYWGTGGDPDYAMPFLHPNRITWDGSASRPICNNGIFKLSTYFDQARRLAHTYTYWRVTSDELWADIQSENRTPKNIITTGTNIEVIEKTFSQKQLAKVTTYNFVSGFNIPDYDNIRDFYLLQDGRITEDPTEGIRARGEWQPLELQLDDDPLTSASNLLAQNLHTHKITIQVPDSETQYLYFDPIQIEVDDQIYTSYISRVNQTSNGYVEYTCGDLQTSLSDKINQYR